MRVIILRIAKKHRVSLFLMGRKYFLAVYRKKEDASMRWFLVRLLIVILSKKEHNYLVLAIVYVVLYNYGATNCSCCYYVIDTVCKRYVRFCMMRIPYQYLLSCVCGIRVGLHAVHRILLFTFLKH